MKRSKRVQFFTSLVIGTIQLIVSFNIAAAK